MTNDLSPLHLHTEDNSASPRGVDAAALAAVPQSTVTLAELATGVGAKRVRACPICLEPFGFVQSVRVASTAWCGAALCEYMSCAKNHVE